MHAFIQASLSRLLFFLERRMLMPRFTRATSTLVSCVVLFFSRFFHFCIFHPLQLCAAFSSPAFSRPAFLCRIFQSCIFKSRIFSVPWRGRGMDAFQPVAAEHCKDWVSLVYNQPPSSSAAAVTTPGRIWSYRASFCRWRPRNIHWQWCLDEVSRR